MTKRLLVLVSLLALAVLVLGACGRSSERQAIVPSTEAQATPATPVADETGSSTPAAIQAEVDLTGTKLVEVVAPKNFRDVEFETPYDRLSEAGARITVISTAKGECVGADGLKVQAVATPKDIKVKEYEGVIFVGGPGMMDHLTEPGFIKLARDFASAGKLTAAICVAPAILANANLLAGKSATAFPDVLPTLKAKGARIAPEDVVVSGKIITANGPAAAGDFTQKLLTALATHHS